MSEHTGSRAFDVVVVIDATGSMDSYLIALQRFIPQLLALRSIAATSPSHSPIERIGVLSYTDYYAPPVIHPSQLSVVNPIPTSDTAAQALIPRLKVEDVVSWSGWVDGKSGKGGGNILTEWVKGLTAEGGGDYPEAAKTALKFLMNLVSTKSPGRETLVLWYTDSPPHHRAHRSVNRLLEIAAHHPPPSAKYLPFNPLLGRETSFSVLNQAAPHPKSAEESSTGLSTHIHGESCTDWIHLSRGAQELGLKVYTILPPNISDADVTFWVVLGTVTQGGTCAIGGRRTVPNQPADREGIGSLEGCVTRGGEFVKAVTKLSLGIVLSELSGGEPDRDVDAPESQYKGEIVEERPLTDEEARLVPNCPPELECVRWISYDPHEARQLSLTEQTAADTTKPTPPPSPPETATVSGSTAHDPLVLAAEDMAPAWKTAPVTDEDEGSGGFLPPPWRGSFYSASWTPPRALSREVNNECVLGRKVGYAYATMPRNEINEDATSLTEEGVGYWEEVIGSLKAIIDADVEAISVVQMFAETWRSVSKLRTSDARDTLFSAYVAQVNRIRDTETKERLLKWADINNDASVEISSILKHQKENADPSMVVSQDKLVLTMDKEAYSELAFTRERLLALATSCDKKTLKDAGYLLRYTRLDDPSDGVSEGPCIDLSISDSSAVFRVLPHLLIQGTLYSPRAASMLAIVALTSHIPHLLQPAKTLLETTRGTWLNPATPENFSKQFIGFMMSLPHPQLMLSEGERETYSGMARYSSLEDNIDTKIQAKTPWTPMKTRGVGDRKRLCDGCGIRRSETMMHQVGTYVLGNMKAAKEEIEEGHDDGMRCGICVDSETKNPRDWMDRGEIASCWVECSERWCRAQYVIEDEEGLRIPPRCYYCRKRKPSPWIECTSCGNRVILPKSYRILPNDSDSTFVCPPCQNSQHTGHKTIVHKLTTLRSILFANDYEVGWLGMRPFREIFRARSTFVIWELYGNEIFMPLEPPVKPSPPLSPSAAMKQRKGLILNGKRLVNPRELREELEGIVGRAMKKGRVLCGISFEHVDEKEVIPACGNVGCKFFASRKGLQEWYTGVGQRRKLCPSCRRLPLAAQ